MARHCIFYNSFLFTSLYLTLFDISTALEQSFSMMMQGKIQQVIYTYQGREGKFKDKYREGLYRQLRSSGGQIPLFYGLPKIHKTGVVKCA